MPSEAAVAILRRKAFALAGQLAGKGESAYQLLHDLTGMESISGQSAGFWSGLVDQLRAIEHRKDRDAPGCTVRQWAFIQALRQQLGMNEDHWRNFLKKQLKIDHQRFLTVSKARGAIAALTRMKAAREAKCESTQP